MRLFGIEVKRRSKPDIYAIETALSELIEDMRCLRTNLDRIERKVYRGEKAQADQAQVELPVNQETLKRLAAQYPQTWGNPGYEEAGQPTRGYQL